MGQNLWYHMSGWLFTSINPIYFDVHVHGYQGFDPLPYGFALCYPNLSNISMIVMIHYGKSREILLANQEIGGTQACERCSLGTLDVATNGR